LRHRINDPGVKKCVSASTIDRETVDQVVEYNQFVCQQTEEGTLFYLWFE